MLQRFSWTYGLLVLTLLAAGCQSTEQVPYTKRERPQLKYSRQEMARLGAEVYNDTLKESEVVRGTPEALMIQRVTEKIGKASGMPITWESALIKDDKVVNAFALPGGKIGVYSGILPVCKDEKGLAVVIAHEVAHVVLQHGNERASQPTFKKLLNWPVSIVAGVWGTLSPGSRRATLGLFGIGKILQAVVPYSQIHESEADEVGLIFLHKAGYDVNEAPAFWRRMQERNPDEKSDALSTHSDPGKRVKRLKEIIAKRY